VIWIIVDDCIPQTTNFIKEDFKKNWEIIHINPTPSWKKGENTQARNLQAGIEEVKKYKVSGIFIIEDDDYYSSNYLSVMNIGLRGFDIIGELETLYYHIGIKKGHRNRNRNHSSLFQTAFTEKMIPLFEEVLKTKEMYLDTFFFKIAKEKENKIQFLTGLDLAIGIKGFSGRAGIGKGHQNTYYRRDTIIRKEILEKLYKYYE
jgi:hypothetical protein